MSKKKKKKDAIDGVFPKAKKPITMRTMKLRFDGNESVLMGMLAEANPGLDLEAWCHDVLVHILRQQKMFKEFRISECQVYIVFQNMLKQAMAEEAGVGRIVTPPGAGPGLEIPQRKLTLVGKGGVTRDIPIGRDDGQAKTKILGRGTVEAKAVQSGGDGDNEVEVGEAGEADSEG